MLWGSTSGFAGQLGPWNYTSSLNVARSANVAVLARDTIIYTFGDWPYSDTPLPVERTTIRSDGTLSPWVEESSQMVEARGDAVGFATDSYIYAIGGINATDFLTTVERAPINSDGTLGVWTTIGATTTIVGDEGALIQYNQFIYVIGGYGYDNDVGYLAAVPDIYQTTINPDGSLGTWTLLSSKLVTGRVDFSAILIDTTIYVVGGYNERGNYASSIERAFVYEDGTLSAFTDISAAAAAHVDEGLFYDGTYLNVIGGYFFGDSNYREERAIVNADWSLGTWQPASYLLSEGGAPFVQTTTDAYMIAITAGGDSNSVEYAPLIPTGIEKKDWEIFE